MKITSSAKSPADLAAVAATLLIMIHSLPVFADEGSDCNPNNLSFEDVSEGLKRLKMPLDLMSGHLKITLVDENGKALEQCTSTVVSDQGHQMTGALCVDECLTRAGAFDKADGFSRINRSKLPSVRCRFRLGDNPEIVEGQVLAVSDCRLKEPLSNTSSCKGVDYALLKLNSNLESVKCLKVSSNPVKPGTDVATIGYSVPTYRAIQRKGAHDVSAKMYPAFSAGKSLAPTDSCFKNVDNPGLQARLSGREAPGDVKFPDNFRSRYIMDRANKGMLIQSDVDFVEGAGGAAMIDQQSGEVRGIATISMVNDRYVQCKGGTFYSAADKIVEDIRTSYPNVDLKQALGCQSRAALK